MRSMRLLPVAPPLWLSTTLSADNWPPWRGPAGGACGETGLPHRWSHTENVAWTIVLKAGRTPEILSGNPIDGRIRASPAIASDRILIRTDDHVIAIRG